MVTVPVTRYVTKLAAELILTITGVPASMYPRHRRGHASIMTVLTAETTEITIGELHEIEHSELTQIYVTISRRVEPGGGQYAGVKFLSEDDTASQFDTVDEALAFIDAVQNNGLPGGIRSRHDEPLTDAEVVEHLQYSHENIEGTSATEYLDMTGITDPFSLTIQPIIETTREMGTETESQEASASI